MRSRISKTVIFTPSVFTPNVVRGDPSLRYVLYHRGNGKFSISPDGPSVKLTVDSDDCGEVCRCGAHAQAVDALGRRLLQNATRINLASEVVPQGDKP